MPMTALYPSAKLRKKVNPEGAESAGPLLYNWARRTSRGMPSTRRQAEALSQYLQSATVPHYSSLGGEDAIEWARAAIAEPVPAITASEGEILVLGLPYGGPEDGRDNDGQFFDQFTEFFEGVIESPPVFYVHGTQNGVDPEIVGKVTGRGYDRQGGWFKVKLDPQSSRYAQLISAHASGKLRASSGVVPASFSVSPNGHIDSWLVGELSLVDLDDGFQPVNGYAITKCVACGDSEDKLFTDYYGDSVMPDEVKSLLDQLRELVNVARGLWGDWQTGIIEPLYKAKEETMDETERCLPCEEAKRKADELRAELAAPVKCAACPSQVDAIRGWVKAGRIPATEAFSLLDRFTDNEDGFEAVKAEIEARNPIGLAKATRQPELLIAGGQAKPDVETTVDRDHMNRQRVLVGLPPQ